jgi:DNA-binding response OmpR family regulator
MEEVGAMPILIVDDDASILEIMEIFLNSIGCKDVVFASSGQQALAAIGRAPDPFEFILLDIKMPEMTGIELLLHIREMKTYEFVPVVMLTGVDDRTRITEAFNAGASDYIVKPFEMFELEARIQNAGGRNTDLKRLISGTDDAARTLRLSSNVRAIKDHLGNDASAERGSILSSDAFSNYCTSLIKQTRASLGVLTMLVDNFDDLSRKLSPEGFEVYLLELARQLTYEFTNLQSLISYQGEDVFMALSFAFDALGEAELKLAAERAITATDKVVFGSSGLSTQLQVGRVLSRDLPANVEPAYMLQVARSHLLHREALNS